MNRKKSNGKQPMRLFRTLVKHVETYYVEEAVEARSAAEAKSIIQERCDHCEYDGCWDSPDDVEGSIKVYPIKPGERRNGYIKRLIRDMRHREVAEWEKEARK